MAKTSEATEIRESAKKTEVPPVIEVENPAQAKTPDPDALYPLEAQASRHRVPGWQAAAVARYMGWENGKQVSDADYANALTLLSARRLGGN